MSKHQGILDATQKPLFSWKFSNIYIFKIYEPVSNTFLRLVFFFFLIFQSFKNFLILVKKYY